MAACVKLCAVSSTTHQQHTCTFFMASMVVRALLSVVACFAFSISSFILRSRLSLVFLLGFCERACTPRHPNIKHHARCHETRSTAA